MWKLLVSAVVWIGLTFALNAAWHVGNTALPPVGKFFSPGEGFWRNAESIDASKGQHAIHLSGVGDEVRILFDERLVPHIFAGNDLDAYFAQGYVTAMYRLWQMDLTARAAAGELSSFLGSKTLEFDKNQRQMGMGFAAENALAGWEQHREDMDILNAYTDGINAYIASLKAAELPVEYKLLNYVPEPWSPLKSAYFAKSMATRLCSAEDDLENTLLLAWLGKGRFDALFPERNPVDDPVIPPGTPWNFEPVGTSASDGTLPPLEHGSSSTSLQEPYMEGSNNWALAGSRTQSGKPILCNDPHLGLSLPSVWFEIQIETPYQNVYGASLPGMPGVIIGFNEHFAWGETNVGQDVLDWYTVQWTDDSERSYVLDGKESQAALRIEKIDVLGHEPVYDTIKYTVWGPVQKYGSHKGLAMRWLAHDVADTREAGMFVLINHATTYDQFVAAVAEFQTPAQNFVYADKEGNIALRVGGELPLRSDHIGRFVQDGSHSEDGWQGRIPASQNPSVLNPERGFVSSANQETTDSTYPYIYFGTFEEFRGRILNRILSTERDAKPQDMKAIQNNTVSLKAEEILPLLLQKADPEPNPGKEALDMLRAWKYDYDPKSSAPVLFELWYNAFVEMLWDDFYARKDSMDIRLPESWRTNLLLAQDPASPEFDIVSTDAIESFQDIARMSFAKAYDGYSKISSSQRDWGHYRTTSISHLAQIPAFTRTLTSAPGCKDALNATTSTHGPSWRMIVSLTDPVEAYVVYPGGQSGNPGSPYYDTMLDNWERGEYYTARYLSSPEDLKPMQILQILPGR